MKIVYPEKLKNGDTIRVIAPSQSMAIISQETKKIANKRFFELGLELSFGKNIDERDDFNSSSIESRVQDIHDAFLDKKVKAIITAIGGFNTNQLLRYLDWGIIRNNPKILCGFSDITILNNAILQKTGLATYYGPHYSSFGQELYFDYTLEYFKKCLMQIEPFKIIPSNQWSDDEWYKDQQNRKLIKNSGWQVINEGRARGIVIGGNLCTLSLLQGTEYFPETKNTILFIEDDELTGDFSAVEFDRDLQSIIHQPQFNNISGIVIGRFQKASKMTPEKIKQTIKSKKELEKIPVIAGVDFGHTEPKITIPIGGKVDIIAGELSRIKFIEH